MNDTVFLPSRRFGGIARLYGDEALARFSRAHVCVVGVGGGLTAAARLTLRRAVSRFAYWHCPERSVWQIGADATGDVQPAEAQPAEIQRVETRSTTKTKVSVPQIPALGLPLEP